MITFGLESPLPRWAAWLVGRCEFICSAIDFKRGQQAYISSHEVMKAEKNPSKTTELPGFHLSRPWLCRIWRILTNNCGTGWKHNVILSSACYLAGGPWARGTGPNLKDKHVTSPTNDYPVQFPTLKTWFIDLMIQLKEMVKSTATVFFIIRNSRATGKTSFDWRLGASWIQWSKSLNMNLFVVYSSPAMFSILGSILGYVG